MWRKKKRDEVKEEAQVSRLAAVAASDTKENEEGDLARIQDALAAVEEVRVVVEARRKAKATRLKVERTSLLLEIGEAKDEVSSLHS